MNELTFVLSGLGLIATMYVASQIAWAYVALATLENDHLKDEIEQGEDQP